MKTTYNKSPLTLDDQIAKLIDNNVIITDKPTASNVLLRIGYYRLSAYWYPFRQKNTSKVISGTTLEKIVKIYEFDRQLRLLILDAIERIEVAIRAVLGDTLTSKYGAFAHLDPANFHPKFNHQKWTARLDEEITRSSEAFINHYKLQYKNFPRLPLWMSTEVMSLGGLSFCYKGLMPDDKRTIAQQFNIHHKRLEVWLHTLTYVRNLCAHHSRLWNRKLAIKPERNIKDPQWHPPFTPDNDRVFYFLLILWQLLRCTEPTREWLLRCELLLIPFAEDPFRRQDMGMPANWQQHPFWQ